MFSTTGTPKIGHAAGGGPRGLSKSSSEQLRSPRGRNPAFLKNTHNNAIFDAQKLAIPTSDIRKKENEALNHSLKRSLQALQVSRQTLPCRSEYVSGTVITLRTNYFEINLTSGVHIYRYTVSISDLQPHEYRKKRRIMGLLIKDSSFTKTPNLVATDFVGLLVTTNSLNLERTRGDVKFQELRVQYMDEEEATPRAGAKWYNVKVEFAGTVSLDALVEYLRLPSANPSFDKEAAITALNAIITHPPNTCEWVFSGARNTKFYPREMREEQDIGDGILALKGYFTSVRASIGRLLVNVNVCTSAFLRDDRPDCIIELFSNNLQAAEELLKKRRVTIGYTGDQKVKTIQGFSSDGKGRYMNANETLMKLQDVGNISIAEYFRKHHWNGKALLNPALPVINVGKVPIGGVEVPVWVPAEECHLIDGQPYGKKLTGEQTTKMLDSAAVPPAENARRIVAESARVLGLTPGNSSLTKFGLAVDNKMIVVEGRKLKEPGIRYANKSLSATNGGWNLRGATWKRAGVMPNWSVLAVTMRMIPQTQKKPVTPETVNEFRKIMGMQGFAMPQCTNGPTGFTVDLSNDWGHIDTALEGILREVMRSSVKVLLVVLDKENTYIYSRIKFFADLKAGIHTVVAVGAKTLKKGPVPSPQYIANLALKFNLKLGGINHALPADRLGFLQKGQTMVVGIDVAHPSPGQIKGGPSMAAVVQRQYKGADEIVRQLGPMLVERLKIWQKFNGDSLPDRILVYRDGVSESQYESVMQEEIPLIEEAYRRCGGKSVLVAFIVVGKRHHTRFYPTSEKESDLTYDKTRNGNPQPGTVVDRGITMESGYDFFLQAHDCLKGTAKSAHYVVLRNDFKDMGAKLLENITHDLCYMFGRATRAVSVVPPARYADLACERGKYYLYKELTIRPDGSNANKTYDPSKLEWKGLSMEDPLAGSMFYI